LGEADERTDLSNALRLVELHGEEIRWCEPWSTWLCWDGTRWAIDVNRAIERRAEDVAQQVWEIAEASVRVRAPMAREWLQFAKASSNERGLRAMVSLARSHVPINPAVLDVDPWALNCVNGTLDLRDGKLRSHDPGSMFTKLCPVGYDPEAECPNFERMVATILGGDNDLIGFVQRALGYSITGDVGEQVLFFPYGRGANGKSTLLAAVHGTIGPDYAMQAADGMLLTKNSDAHPTEMADLFGKRFVTSIEVETGRRLAEARVKGLTGSDPVRARRMRQDFWEFLPTHKLWLAANHKPSIQGTENAIWRRIRLIPFNVVIAAAEQDKGLPGKLAAERPGILAWLVRGCLAWQREGLGKPTAVEAATAGYRAEMDVLGTFIEDCCIVGPEFTAKAADVFKAYKAWCETSGERPSNQRAFGLALSERGIERRKNSSTWYIGLALTTGGREDEFDFTG